MPKVSDIYTELKIDLTPFRAGLTQAASMASGLGSTLQSAVGPRLTSSISSADTAMQSFIGNSSNGFKDVSRVVQGILVSQAFYGMISALKEAGAEVYNFQKKTESAVIAFKYLLGGQEQSKAFLRQLEDFAAVTPFNLDNIRDYARQLLAAGFNAKQVLPVLGDLTDSLAVAGGDPEVLKRVVAAISKIKTQGKVTARQINSIAQAGIPVYQILREELGLSSKELANIGKAGISADKGVNAILTGLRKRYKGASEEISQTTEGLIGTIQDNLILTLSGVFDSSYQKWRGYIKNVAEGITNLREAVRSGGVGKLFETIIPADLQTKFKLIFVQFQAMIGLVKDVGTILGLAFRPLVTVLSSLTPIVLTFTGIIHQIAEAARNGSVGIRILVAAISGLLIAGSVAHICMFFAQAISKLWIAQKIAWAVGKLTLAIKALSIAMIKNPIIAVVSLIAGALFYLVLSSDAASKAIDGLMERLAKLFGLDLGEVLKPTDPADYAKEMGKLGDSLGNVNQEMPELGDNMDKAGKKAKKAKKDVEDLLFAFDEVYRIPEKHKGDDPAGDLDKGLGDAGKALGDLKLPDLGKEKLGENLGKSIRDQLENQGPIVLPGFVWPELPPPPTPPANTGYAVVTPIFEEISDAIANWGPKIKEGFLTALDFTPVLVPVRESLGNIGTTINTWLQEQFGAIKDWSDTVGETFYGWTFNATESVLSFTSNTGTALENWVASAGEAVHNWAIDTTLAFQGWGITATGVIADFVSNTKGQLKTWATDAQTSFSTWATNTSETVKGWAVSTDSTLTNWKVSAGVIIGAFITDSNDKFDSWSQGVKDKFSGWKTSIEGTLNDWANNGRTTFETWKTDTITTLGNWSTETQNAWQDWKRRVGQTITDWKTSTESSFNTWRTNVYGTIGGWAGDTQTAFNTWRRDAYDTINNWRTNVETTFGTWRTNTYDTVSGWAIDVHQSFISWKHDVGARIEEWRTAAETSFNTFKQNAFTTVTNFIEDVKTSFSISGGMAKVKDALDSALEFFHGLWKDHKKTILGVVGALALGVAAIFVGPEVLGAMGTNTATFAGVLPTNMSKATDEVDVLIGGIPRKMDKHQADMWNSSKRLADQFKDAWKGAINWVQEKIEGFSKSFEKAKDEQRKRESEARQNPAGGVLHVDMYSGSVRQFANGGMISRNQFIEVGENNRRETVVPLENPAALAPIYDHIDRSVASAMEGYGGTVDTSAQLRPLYVGTLVADERSLKELQRKMQIIEIQEQQRRGI